MSRHNIYLQKKLLLRGIQTTYILGKSLSVAYIQIKINSPVNILAMNVIV